MSRVTRALAAVLILVLSLAQVACVGYTIRPPESVHDPVGVYVVDYGDTSRLWLPEEAGGFTEWGYGDWKWYAKDEQNLLYGLWTLVWPTAGTLGRHERFAGPFGEDGNLLPDLAGYATHVHAFDAERERVSALRAELHERFERQNATELFNERRQMSFVRDSSSYWLWNQSTTEVADWTRALGCRATGFSLRANYRLKPPGETTRLPTP